MQTVTLCPERVEYKKFINDESNRGMEPEKYAKIIKALEARYKLAFYNYFAEVYPHLRFEIGEEAVYWNYNETSGVYEETAYVTVKEWVMKLLIDDGLLSSANDSFAKTVVSRYRSCYPERGSSYDHFDNDDSLFHANNGWVNLKTLEQTSHTPVLLSRRKSAVDYNAEASCPMYDAFLDKQIQLQPDQVRVIDQFSGLLLTPDITKQKMLVLIGKPGCGKSTLLDLWSDVLGDCATQNSLHEIASESFRFRGSTLVGKTLCWFDEVEVTRTNMGNSLINLITGQQIRVERKGINGIVPVQNKLKCVLTANTLPRSAEMGIYRRMILIYLNYSFYDNMTDNKNIRALLKAEASGVLNRMLKGLHDIQANEGFTTIVGHDDLIEEYKASSNTVAEFLDEHFDFDYEAPTITTKVLLEAYKNYANDKYISSLTPQRFGVLLASHGLSKFYKITQKRLTGGVRAWAGLKLKEHYQITASGLIREKEDF